MGTQDDIAKAKQYKYPRIWDAGVTNLLKDLGYDTRFTFDHTNKRVLLDNDPEAYEPKLFHNKFCTANKVEVNSSSLKSAIYRLARDNSDAPPPKALPPSEEELIRERLKELLQLTPNVTKVLVKELAMQLQPLFPHYTLKSMEIRLSRPLQALGWEKKSSNGKNFWVRGETA